MSDTPRTCIVAEDEALLRDALVAELKRAWPALRIVAECVDPGHGGLRPALVAELLPGGVQRGLVGQSHGGPGDGGDGQRHVAHAIVDLMARKVIHPFLDPDRMPDPVPLSQ